MRCIAIAALVTIAAAGDRDAHAKPPPHISITVTERGFTPDDVTVPAATPVTLVFVRKTDKTCAKQVVLEISGRKLARDLPLDRLVEITVTFPTAGKLVYACGMDMVHGTITVR